MRPEPVRNLTLQICRIPYRSRKTDGTENGTRSGAADIVEKQYEKCAAVRNNMSSHVLNRIVVIVKNKKLCGVWCRKTVQ